MLFGRSGRASQRVRVRVCAPVLIPNPSQAFPTCSSSKCTESVRGCHERERLPTVLFHFDHCRSVERPSCCSTPNVLASSPNNPSCRIDGLLWVSPGKIRLQVQVKPGTYRRYVFSRIPMAEAVEDEAIPLSLLFRRAQAAYTEVDESTLSGSDPKLQRRVAEGLAASERALKQLVALSVFSPNEELDDVNTGDLKYLLLPFYRGGVPCSRPSPSLPPSLPPPISLCLLSTAAAAAAAAAAATDPPLLLQSSCCVTTRTITRRVSRCCARACARSAASSPTSNVSRASPPRRTRVGRCPFRKGPPTRVRSARRRLRG